ncbi:ATP-binding protein [uncultured Thiodictyon sp.]|uniref:ATP-dependent nuclease n=1 Tax=uncultured Thiodictyon sp. TaxID=1846217 RepID=UPI0025E05E7E|nr:ATP-binding protein [uncultured Thiodictyon sp.]
MYLKSFSVTGYRSFANRITLEDLGPVVVLFGTNNAGKSNLLRAIDLFSRLLGTPLVRLLDTTPRNSDAYYEEYQQDAWMFNLSGPPVIELHAVLTPDKTDSQSTSFGFRIERQDGAIVTQLTDWVGCDADNLLARLREAESDYVSELQSESPFLPGIADQIADRWQAMSRQWDQAVVALRPGMTIHRSAGQESAGRDLRDRFMGLTRTMDLARRKRSAWAIDRFGHVAVGLPLGRLEPVENPPDYPNDFGWLSDVGVLPLNQLGSGAVASFSLLATLALAEQPLVGLEEPESHLNAQVQSSLAECLAAAMDGDDTASQFFIVTHSPNFALPHFDIRLVEQRASGTVINKEAPKKMNAFATAAPAVDDVTRTVSLLNYDGSVRLPDYVLDELKTSSGRFVYFVRAQPAGFRIVSEPEMAAMLGEGEM